MTFSNPRHASACAVRVTVCVCVTLIFSDAVSLHVESKAPMTLEEVIL